MRTDLFRARIRQTRGPARVGAGNEGLACRRHAGGVAARTAWLIPSGPNCDGERAGGPRHFVRVRSRGTRPDSGPGPAGVHDPRYYTRLCAAAWRGGGWGTTG